MLADSVSSGYVIGNVAVALIVIVAVGVFCAGLSLLTSYFDRGVGIFMMVAAVLFALCGIGGWYWSTYPFKYDYHHWVTKQGQVVKISSRLVGDGDSGVSQRFVVVLNDGGTYGVDDTRAALLKPGDRARLKCKKEFEWGTSEASQGWGCKWAGGGA